MEGGNKYKVGWSQLSKNGIDKATIFFLTLTPSKRSLRVLNLDKKYSVEEKLLGSNVSNSFLS